MDQAVPIAAIIQALAVPIITIVSLQYQGYISNHAWWLYQRETQVLLFGGQTLISSVMYDLDSQW